MIEMVEYIYIIRGANYEFEEVLYASLDKTKRDDFLKKLETIVHDTIAPEDIPLDHYRTYAFGDWIKVSEFPREE